MYSYFFLLYFPNHTIMLSAYLETTSLLFISLISFFNIFPSLFSCCYID